jgi:hypothetical protein
MVPMVSSETRMALVATDAVTVLVSNLIDKFTGYIMKSRMVFQMLSNQQLLTKLYCGKITGWFVTLCGTLFVHPAFITSFVCPLVIFLVARIAARVISCSKRFRYHRNKHINHMNNNRL